MNVVRSGTLVKMRKGTRVAVVYPASACEGERAERVEMGLDILRSWGFKPERSPKAGTADEYLAASDEVRWEELAELLRRRRLPAIWCARGGYGSARLLPRLRDFCHGRKPRTVPFLLGFSDVTALLSYAAQRLGWPCIHGPNVASLPLLDAHSLDELHNLLRGKRPPEYGRLVPVSGREASGRLLPMNLTILCSLQGTPFAPRLKGRILIIEEVGEAPYRVDRMLSQLALSPEFHQLAALVVADLDKALGSPRLARTLAELSGRSGVPCFTGFPMGHGARNLPVLYESVGDIRKTDGEFQLRLA